MKKTMSITFLEVAKLLKKSEFLIGLILVLVMGGGMAYGAYRFPDSFGVHNVIAFYGNFSSILIMFLAAKSLGEEGFLGIFKGGLTAASAGIAGAIIFGYLGSLAFKPKMKS